MNRTGIEWCDFSANPLKYRRKSDGKVVWGCVKTSPGCAHCYSEAIALRFDRGKVFSAANMEELEPFLDEAELRKMLTHKPASGKRVFVGDMTDVLGPWVPDALLDRLFAAFALRPDVTWQVLTKRAERLQAYLTGGAHLRMTRCMVNFREYTEPVGPWPLPNVWLGVSCEDQQRADERREAFRAAPAAVKFVSYEPSLGPVDWSGWEFVNQIIGGGESGPKARPHHPGWHRRTRDFCKANGIAYFFKQHGAWFPSEMYDLDTQLPVLDGRTEIYVGPKGQIVKTASPYDHGCPCCVPPGYVSMVRVGKKAAGRLLDGVEHSEFPEVAAR